MENEINGYIDKKFKKVDKIFNVLMGLVAAVIVGAVMISISYGRTQKTVEQNSETLHMVVTEYVPGDFLYEITRSYDLQVEYLLALQNGQADEVREIVNEFRQFREDVYNNKFGGTRGVTIIPKER